MVSDGSAAGVIYYDNGDFYQGEVSENVPDGKGTMRYSTGKSRNGFWKLGLPVTSSIRDMNIPGVKDDSYTPVVQMGGCRFCVGYGYDNGTIADAFGISRYYRGIRIHRSNCVLISLSDSVYRDGLGWTADSDGRSVFVYTGEGLDGDQTPTSGNKFLIQSAGKNVFLFVKRKPGDYVFHGRVAVKRVESAMEPDRHGAVRKVYKFILGRI